MRRQNAQDRLRRLETLRAESVSSEQIDDDTKAEFDAAKASYGSPRRRSGGRRR